jgi:hypothetical protein
MKAIALVTYLLLPIAANAQVTFYSTDAGRPLGSSYTLGNTTFFNDAYGNPVSQAVTLAPMPLPAPVQVVAPVAPMYAPLLQPMPLPALMPLPMWGTK